MEGLKAIVEKPVKVSAAYRLSLLLKKLEPEFQTFSTKREELVKKYGVTEDGQNYSIKLDSLEEYQKVFGELLDTDVKVDIQKIKVADLGDLEIEPKYLYMLSEILEE
jgi:hypothetical protein